MALALKLPKTKKNNSPKAKSEFGAKFHAWWNGIEYVPASSEEVENETASAETGQTPIPQEEPIQSEAEKAPNLEESLSEINALLDGGTIEETSKEFIPPENIPAEIPSNSLKLIEEKIPHKIEKNENQAYIEACEILWGVGRLSPTTNELDEFIISILLDRKSDNIAIFGNDLGARARIAATLFPKVNSYEKGIDFKKHTENSLKAIKNCKFHTYDDKPGSVPKNNADALYMAFCGTRIIDIESHIFASERILKPNGTGIWLDFVKMHDGFDIVKCAGNEGREFVTEGELKEIFEAAGLSITEEYDHTNEFINGYDRVNSFLNDDWTAIQAKLMEWGGISAANIALEQVLVWRSRAIALKSGYLVLKRYNFKRA